MSLFGFLMYREGEECILIDINILMYKEFMVVKLLILFERVFTIFVLTMYEPFLFLFLFLLRILDSQGRVLVFHELDLALQLVDLLIIGMGTSVYSRMRSVESEDRDLK